MKKFAVGALATIAVLSLIANYLLYMRFSTSRPVVTVGNQTISKREYQAVLDEKAGKAVLSQLLFSQLVQQAAAKAGAMPTPQQVDARYADIQRRTPQVIGNIANDPGQVAEFKHNLANDMALENLRIQDVHLTDSQIADFYSAHKSLFTLPTQVQTTLVVTEDPQAVVTAERMLRQGAKPEDIALQPGLHVAGVNGFNPNLSSLPTAVSQQISKMIFAMKPGDVKTITVGKDNLSFLVKGRAGTTTPPLAQIKDEVARVAKLQRAHSQPEELAILYNQAHPKFSADKYAAFFSDVAQFKINGTEKKTASLP